MRGVILLLLIAGLGGCATTPPVYDHLDMTGKVDPSPNKEMFQRDIADCRTRGAMVPGDSLMDVAIAGAVIKNCMRSKGWVKRED